MSSVLVLDGNSRSALAATRSLGARGLSVIVAEETERSLAGCSRFARSSFRYPSPYDRPHEFLQAVRAYCDGQPVDLLLPMTDLTTSILLSRRELFPDVRLPFARSEAVARLSNKHALAQLAKEVGVPIPRTSLVTDRSTLGRLLAQHRFPVVLKSCQSRISDGGRFRKGAVCYAGSFSEAESAVADRPVLREHPFLIQDYVRGEGRGLFVLYANGKPLVIFAHRRLRERPPSGGVSVLCESVAVSAPLESLARRLLDAVGWHGVAMVELKVAPDGRPTLIEVNTRFWGSLQLAIDAGVDFPWLLYQVATGREPDPVGTYRVGVRSRWLLGDAAHLYRLFVGSRGPARTWKDKCRAALPILDVLNLGARETRYDVNRWEDPRPFLFEMARWWR